MLRTCTPIEIAQMLEEYLWLTGGEAPARTVPAALKALYAVVLTPRQIRRAALAYSTSIKRDGSTFYRLDFDAHADRFWRQVEAA